MVSAMFTPQELELTLEQAHYFSLSSTTLIAATRKLHRDVALDWRGALLGKGARL